MNEWICISTTTGKLSDCKCQSPNAFWCQVLNFIPLVIKNQRISLQGLRWWSVAKTQSSQCRGPSPIPDQESRSHMPKLKPSTARQINKNKLKKKKDFLTKTTNPVVVQSMALAKSSAENQRAWPTAVPVLQASYLSARFPFLPAKLAHWN